MLPPSQPPDAASGPPSSQADEAALLSLSVLSPTLMHVFYVAVFAERSLSGICGTCAVFTEKSVSGDFLNKFQKPRKASLYVEDVHERWREYGEAYERRFITFRGGWFGDRGGRVWWRKLGEDFGESCVNRKFGCFWFYRNDGFRGGVIRYSDNVKVKIQDRDQQI